MTTPLSPGFEPRSTDTWRDPFPMYRALRDHDPVHRVADNGEGEDYWVLSRFADVFDAAVDFERGRFAPGHFVRRYDAFPFHASGGS